MVDQSLSPIGIAAEKLPAKWSSCPLGELLEEVSLRAKEVDGGSELPILSLTKSRGLIDQSQRFDHRVARNDVSEYKVVQRGWIVYNPMVLWEGAIAALIDRSAGLVSPVYAVWRAAGVDSDYLDLLLKTPAALAEYERLASGVVKRRRTVKKHAFLAIPIPLPPLPEQRAIAHVLQSVQRARETTEQVIASARELKRSLMRHLFSFGPTDPRQAETVVQRDTEFGLVPAHWSVMGIGDFCASATGGTPDRTKSEYFDGPIPWVKSGEVRDGLITATSENLTAKGLASCNARVFSEGTLLIAMYGAGMTAGRVGLLGIPAATNQAVCALFPDQEQALSEYLFYVLIYLRPRIRASRHGSNQPNLSQRIIRSLQVPLPPIDEQLRIVGLLRQVDIKILAEEQRRGALDILFKSLLHDLMSAHLRVPEDLIERVT
jgi:type I restriction enzyme, S subunit